MFFEFSHQVHVCGFSGALKRVVWVLRKLFLGVENMFEKDVLVVGPSRRVIAVLEGLVGAKFINPNRISIGDSVRETIGCAESWAVHFHCAVCDNAIPDDQDGLIILDFCRDGREGMVETLEKMKGRVPEGALVISLMEWCSIGYVQKLLTHQAVVRMLPNTAAQFGESMTFWASDPSLSPAHVALMASLVSAIGGGYRCNGSREYTENEGRAKALAGLVGTLGMLVQNCVMWFLASVPEHFFSGRLTCDTGITKQDMRTFVARTLVGIAAAVQKEKLQ